MSNPFGVTGGTLQNGGAAARLKGTRMLMKIKSSNRREGIFGVLGVMLIVIAGG